MNLGRLIMGLKVRFDNIFYASNFALKSFDLVYIGCFLNGGVSIISALLKIFKLVDL